MPASGLRRRAEVSASRSLEEALALPGESYLQAAQGTASPALNAWQAAPFFLGQQFLDFLPVQRRGEFLLAADGRLDDLALAGLQREDFLLDRVARDEIGREHV